MTREECIAHNAKYKAILLRHLKIGDLLTHTRCGGSIEEHRFTGWSGNWMCGRRTRETGVKSPHSYLDADDIAPGSVTHLNRDAVEALDFIAERNRPTVSDGSELGKFLG